MPNANKVKHRLVDLGMNQADLARASGLERHHVYKILNQSEDIRESTLKKLCKGLKCKAEDIW